MIANINFMTNLFKAYLKTFQKALRYYQFPSTQTKPMQLMNFNFHSTYPPTPDKSSVQTTTEPLNLLRVSRLTIVYSGIFLCCDSIPATRRTIVNFVLSKSSTSELSFIGIHLQANPSSKLSAPFAEMDRHLSGQASIPFLGNVLGRDSFLQCVFFHRPN